SITEAATGYDGYTGIIPRSTGTVAEILRQNGYATAWVGKNHNTPVWETSEIGPFDRWANGLGFDYFYGFNSGDTSQYEPILFENRNRVPRSSDPNYHLSTDIADHSIAWMQKVKVIVESPGGISPPRAPQTLPEPLQGWTQLRPVEVAVVFDPALNVRVVRLGEILQGFVAVMMKGPAPDRPADGRQRLRAGRRHEAARGDVPLPHRLPRLEHEPE